MDAADIRIAAVPAFPVMLEVSAAPDHDWDATLRTMVRADWWGHLYAADDPVGAVRAECAAARERAKTDPSVQRDWQTAAETGPRARLERTMLLHLEQITAMRARLWDPRLDVVADAATVLRAFWNEMAPNVPPPVGTGAGPIDPVQAPVVPSSCPGAGVEAEERLDATGPRGAAVRLLWHRLAAVCTEVAHHAETCAARTKDAPRRAAYLDLAQRCAATAAALQPVLAQPTL